VCTRLSADDCADLFADLICCSHVENTFSVKAYLLEHSRQIPLFDQSGSSAAMDTEPNLELVFSVSTAKALAPGQENWCYNSNNLLLVNMSKPP